MLNEVNVCKLIKKTSTVCGCVLPKEEPIHPTTMAITIDGFTIIRITEYDRKVIAKLIELELMKPDYTFEKGIDGASLLRKDVQAEPATCTQILIETPGKDTPSIRLRLVQTETHVGAFQDKYLSCFRDVECSMKDGKSALHFEERGEVVGLVLPYRYDTESLITVVKKCKGW